MIYDSIKNVHVYKNLDSRLVGAIEYIKHFNATQADGRYDFEGTKDYALVLSYQTRDPDTTLFETHRNYIDVQFIVEGVERLDVVNVNSSLLISEKEYDPEKDFAFFQPPDQFVALVMTAGMFAILFPQNAHRPNCHLTEQTHVRKIVVKVSCDNVQ